MNKTKERDYILILYRLTAVLICCVLLTTHMVAGLFAKYISTASSENVARVATFNILGEGDYQGELPVFVSPSDDGQLVAEIILSGDCEVAVNCSVSLTNVTGNIPFNVTVKKVTGNNEEDVSNLNFTYNPDSGVTDTYRLYIVLPEDTEYPDDNLKYVGMVDYLKVSVTARQID